MLAAFQFFAANIRKIEEFVAQREAEGKKIRKLPSRRRTRSWPPGHLGTWLVGWLVGYRHNSVDLGLRMNRGGHFPRYRSRFPTLLLTQLAVNSPR